VQEILVEAWLEIQKVVPELPEVSDIGKLEHQIKLLQGALTQLSTQDEKLKEQLKHAQQEGEKCP
jgi:DNA anti-recombination protein RmuC